MDPLNGASSQGAQQIQEGKCKKHAQETIKYFCRTHKSVICGDCIVSEHQKCATEFIKDLAKNYKESSEFKTMVRQIQKLETDTAENKTRIERSREENKTLLENVLKDIQNFHREIHVWLDKMENILEVEVRKIYDDNENLLSQLNDKITNISSEIDRIKEELNSYLYQADNLFIRSVECQSRIGNVDKSVSEVKPNNVIKTYAFEPEIKVKEIFTSSVKLGIIRDNRVMKAGEKQMTDTEASSKIVYRLPGIVCCSSP